MEEVETPEASRRSLLGGAAALAAMMMNGAWLSEARAQTAAVKADPRYAFVDRLADLTIPVTDTPGASQAGAPTFVLLALDQKMNGLKPAMLTKVRERLDRDAGGSFVARPAAEQLRLLTALDAAAYAGPAAPETAEQGWRRIKAAIVAGYYSSEVGATTELVYEPIPGKFENIVLTPDFRQRANEGFGGGL